MSGRRWIAPLLVLLAVAGAVARGDAPGEPGVGGLDEEATGALLRKGPPTPDLTRAVRARSRGFVRHALERAVSEMTGEEALNVAAHVVSLGVLPKRVWEPLSFLADSEVGVEGALRRITHPDLHVYVVELDVRRVLAGRIELTPANTPLRVHVGAAFDHARWIQMDPAPGTPFVLFAHHGEILYERRPALVRALTAWGGHAWPATGSEAEVTRLLAPLGWKDPIALLDALRGSDETRRWLATARTLQVCRDLGTPFAELWKRPSFDRDELDLVRAEVLAGLEALRDQVQWDADTRRFVRGT